MIVVTDIRIPAACRAELEKRGFLCITLPPFSALDARIASHPDILLLPLGHRLFVNRKYYEEAQDTIDCIVTHTSLSLILTDDPISSQYPHDVAFNLIAPGQFILGRLDAISGAVADLAEAENMLLVNTKQGYAKCSTVVLGNRALITADPSVEKAARKLSLDVLFISSGYVELEGYDTGFIGGASGVFGNTVYFCGNIFSHPDGQRIFDFCAKHNFQVTSLSEAPLYDVGTLFFFS